MTNHKPTDISRSGDLVERLREQAWTITHMEAADRLEALEAENERLQGLVSSYRLQIDQLHDRKALGDTYETR